MTGFEPAASSSRTKRNTDATVENEELTDDRAHACTAACTSHGETGRDDALAALAEQLRALPTADRAKVIALILGTPPAESVRCTDGQ